MSSGFITRVEHDKDEPYTVIFTTDDAEKYKAVEDECRRIIGHGKPSVNTMYNELIDALRHCTNDLPCETESYRCKYADLWNCNLQLRIDAADAIERLQAENDELRAENETYRKLVLLSVGEINELRYKLHLDEMDIEEIKLP